MRLKIVVDPVTGAKRRTYEEGIDWKEWRNAVIILAVGAFLLYLWNPSMIGEPWKLVEWPLAPGIVGFVAGVFAYMQWLSMNPPTDRWPWMVPLVTVQTVPLGGLKADEKTELAAIVGELRRIEDRLAVIQKRLDYDQSSSNQGNIYRDRPTTDLERVLGFLRDGLARLRDALDLSSPKP